MLKMVKGQRYSQTYKEYRSGKIHVSPTTVFFVVQRVTARTCYILYDNGAESEFSLTSPFHKNCVPADPLPTPVTPIPKTIKHPCKQCGEEIGDKRAGLKFKNCLSCSQPNDRNIYKSMANRIVPAAHKGHITYVTEQANREFIATMMKK